MSEGLAYLSNVLRLPEATGRTVVRAQALCIAGHLYWAQTNFADALPLETEALAIGRELDDAWSVATALHFIGPVVHRLGDPVRAQALLEEGLSLWRRLGDVDGITLSLMFLGDAVAAQGDAARAQLLYEESASLLRQIHETLFLGYVLRRLAQLASQRDDLESATTLLMESLRLNQAASNSRGIAACLGGLAQAELQAGHAWRAAELLGAAQALLDSIHTRLLPGDLAQFNRTADAVRAQLAGEAFSAAWAAGQRLTLEEAIL
jgi:tetratricopeptide (TPR) repeat protein